MTESDARSRARSAEVLGGPPHREGSTIATPVRTRSSPPVAPRSARPAPLLLADRFPALAALPRAELTTLPSPVERVTLPDGAALWVKRDDLDAASCGGNKVRALELLLGDVRPGDTVLTLGGVGSTHVLATATHARRLGARVVALRWAHETTPLARAVARRAAALCDRVIETRTVPGAFVRLAALRAHARLGRRVGGPATHYVPLGGTTPLGVLGHVNAALELAAQVAAGELPAPRRVVVPMGTAGTAAGLALGFAIAGLDATVVGARVGPRLAVTRRRALRLARASARLIERHTGARVPAVDPARLVVVHDVYGGAYGRPLAEGERAATLLREAAALTLDSTYAAKAAAAALRMARDHEGPTLFWMTFDGREFVNGEGEGAGWRGGGLSADETQKGGKDSKGGMRDEE
ncbi:MAG: pyridoxal-phosphate dependent enzyme [Gemmatimonadaceae bacterium]